MQGDLPAYRPNGTNQHSGGEGKSNSTPNNRTQSGLISRLKRDHPHLAQRVGLMTMHRSWGDHDPTLDGANRVHFDNGCRFAFQTRPRKPHVREDGKREKPR